VKPSRDIGRLIEIMAALRTPGSGCPWDLEQNFDTIAPYTLEEAYEVADAIARGDLDHLKDELGDLLLQVVFHARMAQEQDKFDFGGVVEAITTKLIRRHPHVFADAHGQTAEAVKGLWERIKAEEKAERGEEPEGALEGVPVALPALTRALKLQNKAHAATEVGDLLFAVVNLARHLKADPEGILRATNQKFERRFASIERALAAQGKRPQNATLAEMDALWDAAKDQEKAGASK
jgi:ATP diphosphatase